MQKLHDYRCALLAVRPEVTDSKLERALDTGGQHLVKFIIDHGLGPIWHQRTGRADFRASRMAAEAMYLAQAHALSKLDAWFGHTGIEYAVIKGAATRLIAYENPAVRACHDIDLLIRPEEKVKAGSELLREGFSVEPDSSTIGHELAFSRGSVNIDLHWQLLRDGRLRTNVSGELLARRQRRDGIWILDSDDTLFVLLVHPAFAKHLAGWMMGLHRVADVLAWVDKQAFDWSTVRQRLHQNGVAAAAWATLRWIALLTEPHTPDKIAVMAADLSPGSLRRAWISRWLEKDLSARSAGAHWLRLIGFSTFLHDTPRDALRALAERYRAYRRQAEDLSTFKDLLK